MDRLRLPEVEIPENDPFKKDGLDREPCADLLKSLAQRYAKSGGVIMLNGKWGTGKTTFVKMLIQKLKNEGWKPLYFNAWQYDYLNDSLVAIMSAIKGLSPNSQKWEMVKTYLPKLLSVGFSIFNINLNAVEDIAKVVSNIVNKQLNGIDEFESQKETFEEFRNALKEYIDESTQEEKPVMFFVDELDRCSPRFAVNVLERIKHLFDIPNVIFILSINKEQIIYSIQGYFGSANMDANNYMKRFVDLEFNLPQPKSEKLFQLLWTIYQMDDLFAYMLNMKGFDLDTDINSFKKIYVSLIDSNNLEVRTLDKIFAHTNLAIDISNKHQYIYPDVFFLLSFYRTVEYEFYDKLACQKYKVQDLLTIVR